MQLKGRVGQGQGYASGRHGGGLWLRSPLFSKLLGTPIYPASINVFVRAVDYALVASKHPLFRDVDEELRPEGIRKKGFLLARPCTVNGDPAWILRTEHPGPTHTGKKPPPLPMPHTMFEIAATKKLKWVKYGAFVTIDVDTTLEPVVHTLKSARKRHPKGLV
jgi:hypothetical protein